MIRVLRERDLWEQQEKTLSSRRVVAEYNYTDGKGNLLYQVVRTEPKSFFQRFPDGRGGWVNRKYPQQVLYRLHELMNAPIILIGEGEKDVDTLRTHGFIGTTIAGGANARWLPSFTDVFRGREVVLIPDNDPPGWALMRRIAEALLGQVAKLICFDDHHRAGAKDISDWFAQGRSETEFISLLERDLWHSK